MKSKSDVPLNRVAFTTGTSMSFSTGEGELALESAEDQISFMSDFNIKRDAVGLALARDLVDVLLGAIQTMKDDQQAGRLPPSLMPLKATVKANPLA